MALCAVLRQARFGELAGVSVLVAGRTLCVGRLEGDLLDGGSCCSWLVASLTIHLDVGAGQREWGLGVIET